VQAYNAETKLITDSFPLPGILYTNLLNIDWLRL